MIKIYHEFFYTILLSIISIGLLFSQINPNNVEIIRDEYGVPHIFAKTDAEVAYGLAWAHSEDDFETIQKSYLAGNGILSKLLGIKGARADFVTQFINSKLLMNFMKVK